MLVRITRAALLLSAVALATFLLTGCEEAKPVLKYVFILGPDGTFKVEGGTYKDYRVSVTEGMLQWGDKQATIYVNLDTEGGHAANCSFYIFDALEFLTYQVQGHATPLNETNNTHACTMWATVSEPGDYYVVIKDFDDYGHTFEGHIYVTYWEMK